MTEERRYREEEIRLIFESALAEGMAGAGTGNPADGLTLGDLQAIAREVGVDPERVEQAALALEVQRGAVPRNRLLGKSISTGLVVDLPRGPTDGEWELLVAELRQTFLAEGRVRSSGSSRRWSNGNLFAAIEPTDHGFRLRLGTRKSNAISFDLVGVALLMMGLLVLVRLLGGGWNDEALFALLMCGAGAGLLAYNAYRLPRWVEEREGQMNHIAGRALGLIGPTGSVIASEHERT